MKHRDEEGHMGGNSISQSASHPASDDTEPTGQGTAAGIVLPARFPLGLKIGFWFCMVIAVAVVIRRVAALSTPPNPNAPPQLASLDAWFTAYATLTYVHILCALVFVLLLPLLFWHRTRNSVALDRAI